MRYGPIVAKGLRFSGPAGTTWEVAYQAGSKLIAPYIAIPLVERHFDNKWEKQQAELSREIADLRSLGEQRRQWQERKKDFMSLMAGALAVRKLTEDGRGPWARDTAEDSAPAGSGKSAWDAETPAAEKDPWAAESPDVRFARPVAVKTAPAPVKEVETGPSNLREGSELPAGRRGAIGRVQGGAGKAGDRPPRGAGTEGGRSPGRAATPDGARGGRAA